MNNGNKLKWKKKNIKNQIKKLISTTLSTNNYNINILHNMQLTVIDGEVYNLLVAFVTSAQILNLSGYTNTN